MGSIMFLTHRMSMGFGVSVVVHELSKTLVAIGYSVCIGTIQSDYEIAGVQTYIITPDPDSILSIAVSRNVDVIVAHTSPFFEVLPAIAGQFKCWAWEHGDPSPEFFSHDRDERQRIIANKQQNVYPYIDGIISISRFISYDIGCCDSEIVYNGCDHTENLGKKKFNEISISPESPLKIGTLMRLGEGEALYKGNDMFLSLCDKLKRESINAEFFVMGRGSRAEAKAFEEKGIKVLRNASDEERSKYLRNLDILVSPSQWEGFNLPLVEAMKSGTLSLAFDIGAHPEVCPFIYSSILDMVAAIKRYSIDRELLISHSEKCYNYVNSRFSWGRSVMRFLEVMNDHGVFANSSAHSNELPKNTGTVVISKKNHFIRKFLSSLKSEGIIKTLKKIIKVLMSR